MRKNKKRFLAKRVQIFFENCEADDMSILFTVEVIRMQLRIFKNIKFKSLRCSIASEYNGNFWLNKISEKDLKDLVSADHLRAFKSRIILNICRRMNVRIFLTYFVFKSLHYISIIFKILNNLSKCYKSHFHWQF